MKKNLPTWALRKATPQDYEQVKKAQSQGTMQVKWPESNVLRAWAKEQKWATSWFSFQNNFLKKMLETDETFALALNDSGVELIIPVAEYRFSAEQLQELDALYAERGESGRPNSWGILVEKLRDVRRAVEAGVVVTIDGETLKQFSSFYTWVHGRYHMLEDGYDSWVGDDTS